MKDQERRAPAQALVDATVRLAGEGIPLMMRVAPPGGAFVVWDHYPPDDCIDRLSGCRWFYHAHPPGEREGNEHGHFHLFFDRSRFRGPSCKPIAGPPDGRSSGADVVHVVAIAINLDGLPTRLFTVNRWVTDEWLYSADAIERRLPRFDLTRAGGDLFVNLWLTNAVAFFRPEIAGLLRERDRALAGWADKAASFEDRALEILSSAPIDINAAVAAAA